MVRQSKSNSSHLFCLWNLHCYGGKHSKRTHIEQLPLQFPGYLSYLAQRQPCLQISRCFVAKKRWVMGRNSKYCGISLDRVSISDRRSRFPHMIARSIAEDRTSIFCNCLRSWYYLLRSSAITIIADDHRSVFPYDRRQSQNIFGNNFLFFAWLFYAHRSVGCQCNRLQVNKTITYLVEF